MTTLGGLFVVMISQKTTTDSIQQKHLCTTELDCILYIIQYHKCNKQTLTELGKLNKSLREFLDVPQRFIT